MDKRTTLSTLTRPTPPQRAASGSSVYFAKPGVRPSLPSRLSSVRSASQPSHVVDLTAEGLQASRRGSAASFGLNGSVCTSPDIIQVDDEEDGQPPAKRARLTGDGLRAGGDGEESEHGLAYNVVEGEELPAPPKQTTPNAQGALARRRRRVGESTARKATGVVPPPVATKLPPPKNVADFCVWTGNHPEDTLNDAVVKAGYSDTKLSSTNESNSAKPSIWQNLTSKNNTGLQMLSYLFTQVLDKKQALGKCTAPSTFKPPPRVTVTDTKREAWLRDLANPDVPLRKQSRTIPHGIRGKLLLDQCLSKDIPLQRAVWLAKCVGANELRAFRRKGVTGAIAASGESKWVREWTVSVEQFFEGVIASCGEQEWQGRMNYAVKLVTALYAEGLLEVDHYLDWIVSNFAEATIGRLPIWIVLVLIFWKHVIRFVRRGRTLAEATLAHIHGLHEVPRTSNEALRLRLQKLIAVLAVTSRGCLVIPSTWQKYKHLLKPSGPANAESTMKSIVEDIARRNERLVVSSTETLARIRGPLVKLYDILDSVGLDSDIDELTKQCSAQIPDTSHLLAALLDWASTPYRYGDARVYLSATIIQILRRQGHDTDAAVLAWLGDADRRTSAQLELVYRVIGELVRFNAFAVGRYLQFLISTG
ncbi:hypothetical protein BAUCODRAFT_66410, partial [Baudoinia panamericana UAMH 10762]